MSGAAAPKYRPSLLKQQHPLAEPDVQVARLESLPVRRRFEEALEQAGVGELLAQRIEVLQINLGKRCNQSCRHCHVDAGPDRTEVMTDAVVDRCLELLEASRIATLDITGGAPELHPRFREIVERATRAGRVVMDRCNLTILRTPSYTNLPEFFAERGVVVIASLPWYAASRTDAQRGEGVFEASLEALRRLNQVGYGVEGSGLLLHLVTNPAGAYLPPRQDALERDWKRELQRRHGVSFNRLFTLCNMPVSRYLAYLEETEQLETYLGKLVGAFNPAAVAGLMCRTTLSVSWDGKLYDCDFNQMLELALPDSIFEANLEALAERRIRVGQHCFGCTAGAGSSCGGALT